MIQIAELLDRPIAFQRGFVRIGAGITGALMLSQAVYWSKRTRQGDGWFYKTQAEWMEETGLTRYEQEGARKKLCALGILAEAKRGVPCKTFYKVDFQQLSMLLLQYAENPQTGMRETSEQGGVKHASNVAENQQPITEITQRLSETNPENTSAKPLSDSPTDAVYPKWFEVLYASYPPDTSDKLATLTQCSRLLATGHQVADLMAAMERYTLSVRDGAFMPAQEFFGSAGNISAQWGVEFDAKPAESESAVVLRIFKHWQERMNHPGSRLDDKRRKLIAKALKLGYAEENLIAAIDGCAKSAYHMGQNDSGKVYDSIDLIFRSADKIDGFIKTNSLPIRQSSASAGSRERFSPAAFHARQEAKSGQVIGNGLEALNHG